MPQCNASPARPGFCPKSVRLKLVALFGCNPRLRASLLDDRTVETVFWTRDEGRCRLVARVFNLDFTVRACNIKLHKIVKYTKNPVSQKHQTS
eukprot:22538-Prymnesium_polylepis.1